MGDSPELVNKSIKPLAALSLGLERFLSVSILRMVCALPDRLRLSSAVIAAGLTPPCSGVLAAFLGTLGFGLATQRFAGEDVGQRHG